MRLMHKKLEIVISGTRSGTWFRGGIYEGKQGYLVITDKVKNVRADVFVRVESVVSSPWTRIPIRYVWPNGSSFRVSTRVVVTGPSIDGRDDCVGSYGMVLNCDYALREDVRMVYTSDVKECLYFHVDSLCPSGAKAEWMGYVY